MILSILIPTLEGRSYKFHTIWRHLAMQINELDLTGQVEIVECKDNGEMNIGEKRNKLMKMAEGEFIVFVDDDDQVSNDYVKLIYNAIKNNPDIDSIGIRGTMSTNGKNHVNWCVREKYDWTDNIDGFRYVRYTHHLCPVRKDWAIEAGFPEDVRSGEDSQYSNRLKALGRLKKEYFIDKEIYHYDFQTKK